MVQLENGYPFDSDTFGSTGDIPLVRIRDMRATEFETFVPHPVPERVMVRNDDVIIGMDGDFDVVRWRRGPAALNQRLCRLRPLDGTDIRFVAYSLPRELQFINDTQYATTVKHLSSGEVLRTVIKRPPLETQRLIADFLDDQVSRIDEAVRLRRKQVDDLAARRLEFARVVTTQGVTRGATLADSGVPWMPTVHADWPLVRLGSLFATGSGTTPKSDEPKFFDGGIPWLNTGDLRDGLSTKIRKSVSDQALREYSALKVYPAGSLVMAMYGATVGRLGFLPTAACVNQACCVLTEAGEMSSDWAFFWLLAHRPEILRLAYGGGQPNISQETIRTLRVPVPTAHAQAEGLRALHEHGTNTAQVIAEMTAQIALLEERKRSLITAAVTGGFDVTTASGRGV